MQKKTNPRALAAEVLNEIENEGAYSNLLLRRRLPEIADPRDRALATELVYGVTAYRRYLDYIIDLFAKTPTNQMEKSVRTVLRLGVFQLLKLNKIPPQAAVNESVELIKQTAGYKSAGFVNGVLRTIGRQTEFALPKDPLTKLAVCQSFPQWMAVLLRRRVKEDCEALMQALNTPPSMVLRVNPLKGDRESLQKQLAEQGITAEYDALAPDGLFCRGFSVGDNRYYKEGKFSVQDSAAQLTARALNPQSGERVLDMCAAPGGKTCYIAELMGDTGSIEALDIYPHKKQLIDAQAKRLGLHSIHTAVQDALTYDAQELYDKVLVDAPCSGLGIIGRKPEIKWNRSREMIAEFSGIQRAILQKGAEVLKIGGQLLYSTCTLTEEENEGVIEDFLTHNDGFSLCGFSECMPPLLRQETECGMITLWPHIYHTDGFFMAKLQRNQ